MNSRTNLKSGDMIAFVCCSNGMDKSYQGKLDELRRIVESLGLVPVFSHYIYADNSVRSGTAKERADSVMNFYRDDKVSMIFDLSGGDIANEVLPYLDYEWIAACEKSFWGYSDLTTVLNAIYAKTGRGSVLYQIRNLTGEAGENQQVNFKKSMLNGENKLFDFSYRFFQGNKMSGVIVGGNIRCFLKLAGTEYLPDMNGKILLLEACGGDTPQIITYFNQLQQMKVFGQISGVLLGTFTKMCGAGKEPYEAAELLRTYAGENLPIAMTNEIGHGPDAKAVEIGSFLDMRE